MKNSGSVMGNSKLGISHAMGHALFGMMSCFGNVQMKKNVSIQLSFAPDTAMVSFVQKPFKTQENFATTLTNMNSFSIAIRDGYNVQETRLNNALRPVTFVMEITTVLIGNFSSCVHACFWVKDIFSDWVFV